MASPLITRLRFDISRNVGIGTNKPITNLDVSGNIRATNTITATNINVTGTLTQNNVPVSGWTTSGSSIYYNNGNVGIGSSNPQAKLDVSGNMIINNSSNYQIKKNDNTAANILSLDIGNALRLRGGGGSVYINPDNTGGTTFINFNNANNIGLYNGSNPRIITTSLGVGINKTPSTNLDVSGNTSLTGNATVNGNMTISGNIIPGNNITYDLGSSTNRFRDLYLSGSTIDISGSLIMHDSVTNGIKMMNHANNTITAHLKDVIADGNVTVGGDFTVNGNLTTLDTQTIIVEDPIITLGGYQTLTVNDNKDRGIEFKYYDGSSKIGFFGYDNTTGNLIYLTNATNTNEVFTGTYGTIEGATFKSTVSNGAAPLTVNSSTIVTNLNADLLDGQQGSYYNDWNNLTNKPNLVNTFNSRIGDISLNAADISNALTYIPLNAATYTASDILGKLVTVDGSGCGLDADYLDGQNGLYYQNMNNVTNGTLSVQYGGTGNNALTSGKILVGNSMSAILSPNNLTWNTSNNRLGIGSLIPSQTLDVSGNINFSGALYQNGSLYVGSQWTTTGLNVYYNLGNVGIGTSNPTQKLYVQGQIYATDNITAYSDVRFKTNISKIENVIEKIKQINGYTYNKLDSDKSYMGVIAQEVQQVFPELVESQGETLSVAYGNMVAPLIEVIKQLIERVEILESNVMEPTQN